MNSYCIKTALGIIVKIHTNRSKAQKLVDQKLGAGKYSVYRTAMHTETLNDYLKRL